jgi:glycogen debranching enzyme
MTEDLVRLRPRPDQHYIHRSRSVLVTNKDGFVEEGTKDGLRIYQTRTLSKYRYLIDGEPPKACALSQVKPHSWMGYYIASPKHEGRATKKTIELRVSRFAGHGLHEELDFANYTQERVQFRFEIELDADFADQDELPVKERNVRGRYSQTWRDETRELVFDFRAQRRYDQQGDTGVASFHQALTVRIEHPSSDPAYTAGGLISFAIDLEPRATWHACINFIPTIDSRALDPIYPCRAFEREPNAFDRKRDEFLDRATSFQVPGLSGLSYEVIRSLRQAALDLAELRLHDLDRDHGFVIAAGVPEYTALFGRDSLFTGWAAALLSDEILRGVLPVLADSQGTETNDWRDEQPGRMLHQVSNGPLPQLNFKPFHLYYGTLTTPDFFPYAVAQLWQLTADRALVEPLIEPALKALQWSDTGADLLGNGFAAYKTRSEKGVKNQGWKDSGDAIVHAGGAQAEPPIAPCEEQAFLYASKVRLGEVLSWLGREDEARRLFRQAGELKKRFNDVFWMEDEGFFAMGLDGRKEKIRSISSNPGHVLGTGIVEDALARRTVDRLMAEDLFSGWGVRTLSARHPAYDPFSYQRGSVWPVENGMFAIGMHRYGFHDHLARLSEGIFSAAAGFEHFRLPEVFGGQPRDRLHPFPAVYPEANWPQAWSSSAVFQIIAALTGAYPYAPLKTLFVDPHLPEWLPELTLGNLRVGPSVAAIRFFRSPGGWTDFEVLEIRGELKVKRQRDPWLESAKSGERFVDTLRSLAA